MTWTSVLITFARTFLNAILAAFTARPAGPLGAAFNVHLLTGTPFALSPDTTLATLQANEATYSGYALLPITSWTLVRNGYSQGIIGTALFVATAATPFVPGTVTGYWIDDGTNWLVAEFFASGVVGSFAAPGDYLALDAVLPLQGQQTVVS